MDYLSQKSAAQMPKGPDTIRKEVHLLPEVIKELQELADRDKRSLKNYMEMILENHLEQIKKLPSKKK